MSKTAWPTADEVTTRVEGLGGTVGSGITLADEIDAVIEDFQSRTGFPSFLAGAAAARDYNPPADPYILPLVGGIVQLSSLKVGKSASYAGEALASITDFRLEALRTGGPYEIVRFTSPQYGAPGSIEITAVEGWGTSIPLDVWLAVLGRVSANVMGAGTGYGSIVASEIKQGPVTIKNASGGDALSRIGDAYETVVAKYRKFPL